MAVGAVIMNRVRSAVYPNSIAEVIYQPGQFGPAMTGWLDSILASGGYTDTAMQAAADALAGLPVLRMRKLWNPDRGSFLPLKDAVRASYSFSQNHSGVLAQAMLW